MSEFDSNRIGRKFSSQISGAKQGKSTNKSLKIQMENFSVGHKYYGSKALITKLIPNHKEPPKGKKGNKVRSSQIN